MAGAVPIGRALMARQKLIGVLNGYSSHNVGDWVLMDRAAVLVQRLNPGARVEGWAMDPESFAGRLPLAHIHPSPVQPTRLLRSLAETAMAILTRGRVGPASLRRLAQLDEAWSVGGGFFQYRGLRETCTISAVHVSQWVLCRLMGVRLIMLPQSVGPFESRAQRRLARRALSWFDVLLVREHISERYLIDTFPELRDRIRLVPDLAFLLDSDRRSGSPTNNEKVKRVGIVVRQWWFPGSADPRVQYETYLRKVAEVVDRLESAGHVVDLIVHSTGPTARGDDAVAVDGLLGLLGRRVKVVRAADMGSLQEILDLYRGYDAMLATRLHAALMALAVGTPAFVVNYEWKSRGIFHALDLDDAQADIESFAPGGVVAAIESMLAGPNGAVALDAAHRHEAILAEVGSVT
jgi:polysaccharide pyruvyl transferase WcaK-like protein